MDKLDKNVWKWFVMNGEEILISTPAQSPEEIDAAVTAGMGDLVAVILPRRGGDEFESLCTRGQRAAAECEEITEYWTNDEAVTVFLRFRQFLDRDEASKLLKRF